MIMVAVCALQGAFAEHETALRAAGAETFQIREAKDLARPFDALVLPGGESTVQGKLLLELNLFEPLRERIRAGMPVLATCAGLILLAETLSGEPAVRFKTLPVSVRRNAYGRQTGSFQIYGEFAGMRSVEMTFIRAPLIEECRADVEVLARHGPEVTAVRYGSQIAMSFHPELSGDLRIHRYFLEEARKNRSESGMK